MFDEDEVKFYVAGLLLVMSLFVVIVLAGTYKEVRIAEINAGYACKATGETR